MSQESTGIHWLLSDTNFILSSLIGTGTIRRTLKFIFSRPNLVGIKLISPANDGTDISAVGIFLLHFPSELADHIGYRSATVLAGFIPDRFVNLLF